MSRILMVRHGETELNSSIRYWGHSDVKLSALGIRQAERLKQRLAAEKIDAVYSSNLVRASATADIIVSTNHPPAVSCPELSEINFGKLEGLTFEEISRLYPDVAKLWVARDPKLEYPDGESRAGFSKRVGSFLDRLRVHGEEENILVVAHSGVLRTLICQLLGVGMEIRWQLRLDLASLSIVETHPVGAVLTMLNNASHLV